MEVISTALATSVARRFAGGARVALVQPLTSGHINASFIVSIAGERRRLLLQRINERVFPEPRLVMENVEAVVKWLSRDAGRGTRNSESGRRRTDAVRRGALVPELVPALDGTFSATDDRDGIWRAFAYVEDTRTLQAPATPEQARAAARAFGEYQRCLVDLPGPRLHETIAGFHDTPRRLAAFEESVRADAAGRAAACREEVDALLRRASLADALLAPYRRGELPERVVHNDAKIANLLFDERAVDVLRVVDLDTTMPGLALYDFGDMARTMSTAAAEDEKDLSRVRLQRDFFGALADGYMHGAGPVVTKAERALLVSAAQVITYEQALRFLGDHLAGDRYYRTTRSGHNLHRARVQIALLRELEVHRSELEDRIAAAAQRDWQRSP